MDLFRISRELQLEICSYGQSMQVLHAARGECFYRGGGWEGLSKQRVHGFSLAESPPGKKSLSSPCWAPLSSQGLRTHQFGLPSLFHWDFCLLINIFTVLPGWNLNSFVNCTKIFRISLLPKSGLTLSTFCLQNNTCPSHRLFKTSVRLSVYLPPCATL